MSIGGLINRDNFSYAYKPITRDSANIVETTGLAVDNALSNFNTFSASNMKNAELDARENMIFEKTGKSLRDIIGEEKYNNPIARLEETDKLINENQGGVYTGVPTSARVLENARERANLSSARFQEAMENTSLSGKVGGFIGSLGGAAVDPLNIAVTVATIPLGGAGGASILRTVALEAGVNASAELAAQPAISSWQRELGQEYGFTEMAQNVGMAALIGGGFAWVMRGARPAASAVFEKLSTNELLPKSARLKLQDLADYAHVKDSSPFIRKSGEDFDTHLENLDNVSRGFENGKNIDQIPIRATGDVLDQFKDASSGAVNTRKPGGGDDLLPDQNISLNTETLSDAEIRSQKRLELDTIAREAEAEPNFRVELEDGQTVSLRQIKQNVDEANALVEAINVCGV